MALEFIVPKLYTVVLETYDGQQYGMMSLSIEAFSEQEARDKAVELAEEDGWKRIKVQFVL